METFQKPLTREEENEYLRMLNGHDAYEALTAKKILIERNLRLVAHVAKKYQSAGEDMEDLISIGCIGLIKAIDTFDAGKGRLATYACRCIDNELLMMLRGKKKLSREVSLYEPIGSDREGNEICLVDVVEQENIDVVEEMVLKENLKILPYMVEECLNDTEKEIIKFRYGLCGNDILTQQQIGEKFEISRSYVSRIEKRALGKLHEGFAKKTKFTDICDK